MVDRIQTDADRLYDLICRAEKISQKEASKTLKISESLIETWAEILHENRLIEIEYGFKSPFFILKGSKYSTKNKKSLNSQTIEQNTIRHLDRIEADMEQLDAYFKPLIKGLEEKSRKISEMMKSLKSIESKQAEIEKSLERSKNRLQETIENNARSSDEMQQIAKKTVQRLLELELSALDRIAGTTFLKRYVLESKDLSEANVMEAVKSIEKSEEIIRKFKTELAQDLSRIRRFKDDYSVEKHDMIRAESLRVSENLGRMDFEKHIVSEQFKEQKEELEEIRKMTLDTLEHFLKKKSLINGSIEELRNDWRSYTSHDDITELNEVLAMVEEEKASFRDEMYSFISVRSKP